MRSPFQRNDDIPLFGGEGKGWVFKHAILSASMCPKCLSGKFTARCSLFVVCWR